MASSGLREPQFSEDLAWLPPWLQPLRELVPEDTDGDVRTASQQACKEMHANSEKDAVLLSSEEVRYKSCHLFLSGDDSSPVGAIESLGNQFLHFHLHLSSSGISEHTQSPDCNFRQTDRHKFSDVLPRLVAETSPCREKETNHQKRDTEINIANDQVSFKSGMNLNFKVHNLTKSERIGKPNETDRCRNLISSDIKDAIELSIAASEALVISEIAKVDSAAEALSASAILEVALHMKQARNCWHLNRLESVSDCITDETDQLMDLDEDIMSDAFEDVGLSIGEFVGNFGYLQPSGSLIKQECSLSGTLSRVLETPVSVNCGVDSECQEFEERTENDDFICVSSLLKSEKVQAADSLVLKNKPSKYGVIGKKLSGDLFLSISDQENSKATTQAMDMGMVDVFLYHTPESLSSPQVQDSRKNAGPNGLHNADRFRSRWLGGWTGSTRKVDATKSKSTTKVVTEDTGFMTEHGGVSDENCLLRDLEVEVTRIQLSHKACELSCGTDNNAIIPSQDFEMSSNLSLIDPLCSVVPCSISIENANGLGTNGGILEVGKCSSPLVEHSLEKQHLRITGSCADVFHGDETAVKFDSGTCGVFSRREFGSLRKYSTLLAPNIDGFLPRLDSASLHLSKEIIDWNKSFSKEDSRDVFSKPTSKVSAGIDHEEGHVISEIEEPIINLTKEKISSDEIRDIEGKMQLHQQEERSSPKVLNCGIRRRLQAYKIVSSDDVRGVTSIATSGPKPFKTQTISTCVDQRKTAEITSLDVSKNQKAHKDPTASRKRVHFSEPESKKFQLSPSGKLQSGDEICAAGRPSKRVRKLSFRSDLKTQEVNAFQIKVPGRERKRMIFLGLEFLLTGFSNQKEKELEMLIRNHGGYVLSDVPPPPNSRGSRRSRHKRLQLPIVLAPKKLQTTKFLYGCAVNSFVLKGSWLTDSSMAGCVVPPKRYLIIPFLDDIKPKKIGWPVCYDNRTSIFCKIGIMLHGNHSFWANLGKIIKHGGGQVFKTLQQLSEDVRSGKISTGVIVAEDEGRVSRHLKQCALDEKLPLMPTTWIINSLHVRKLCPLEEKTSFPSTAIKIPKLGI
ncbi:hypothetical protein Scep_004050 [Stephania cephalantha]|uniref:BRCT domain-containing protein n=1 Tax=Stephania cephalantha TaxID=152367 RepID=A0AAP0KRQ1_9MAGN